MMFHIQDILSHRTGPTSLTVSSGDSDVFVCLLYHITNNWRHIGLQDLWLVRNSGVKRCILPLHDICKSIGDELTQCLPALHALTGCDTTSKISTKLAALNAVRKPDNCSLISHFTCPQFTESTCKMAESFLVKCLKPSTKLETFDEIRLSEFESNALNIDLEKTPCTSANARTHIQRANYQTQLWIQALFRDATLQLNAETHGFKWCLSPRNGHLKT